MWVHKGEHIYSYSVCKKVFRHLTNIRQCQYLHTEQNPCSCDVCNKTLINVVIWSNITLCVQGRAHTRAVCIGNLSDMWLISRNMRGWIQGDVRTCAVCVRKLFGIWLSSSSMRVCIVSWYLCVYMKASGYESNIKGHQRVHAREQPYSCVC